MKHLTDDELQNYIDSGKNVDLVSAHLNRCDLCRENLTNYRTLFSELSQPHRIRLQHDFTASILSRIGSQSLSPHKHQIWAFLSAMLSLIMGIGAGLYFTGFKSIAEFVAGTTSLTGYLRELGEAMLGFTVNLNLNYSLLAIGILSLTVFSLLDHLYIKSRGRSFTPRS